MSKICSECGQELPDGAEVCNLCGARLPTQQYQQPQQQFQQQYLQPEPQQPPRKQPQYRERSGGAKKTFLGLAIAAVVVLAMIFAARNGGGSNTYTDTNTPAGNNAPPAAAPEKADVTSYPWYSAESQVNFSNLQNGGYVAEAGECIIYVFPKDNSSPQTIHMMNKDGSDVTDLCQAIYPHFINVAGQYVFFYSSGGRNATAGSIMRYDLLTGELVTIRSDILVTFMRVMYDGDNSNNNKMIIDSRNGNGYVTYYLSLDGSYFQLVDEDDPYHLLNGSTYANDKYGRTYFSLNSLEAYRYGGGRKELVYRWNPPGNWTSVANYVLDDEHIYVATADADNKSESIYKAALSDDPDFEPIINTQAHYLQVAHGKLFYLDGNIMLQTATYLYMVNTDGSDRQIVE